VRTMTVYVKDGTRFYFHYRDNEAWCTRHKGNHWNLNEIDESSINAVVGEQLSFIDYYGPGILEYYESDTPIIKIEYYD